MKPSQTETEPDNTSLTFLQARGRLMLDSLNTAGPSQSENHTNVTPTFPNLGCPTDYPEFMKVMYVYILPPTVILGIIGNLISFSVFYVQRRHHTGSTNLFLRLLALTDSMYLITNIFSRILPTIAKYCEVPSLDWSIYNRPRVYALASMTQMAASYMVVVVTVHRYCIICHSLKTSIWFSSRRMRLVLTVLFTFCILYTIPRLFEFKVIPKFMDCIHRIVPTLTRTRFGANRIYSIVYLCICRFVFRGFIPVVIVLGLTVRIVQELRRSRILYRDMLHGNSAQARCVRQTLNLSHMLVVMWVVFIVCQTPSVISAVLNSVKRIFNLKVKQLNNFHQYFVIVCNMLLTVNSATNMLIYFTCGTEFRQTIKKCFSCVIRRYTKANSYDLRLGERQRQVNVISDQNATTETPQNSTHI